QGHRGFALQAFGMRRGELVREFLRSRRARVDPGVMGLPEGGRRRVSGLRREEVALLAGVSVDYYVQIERGKVANVSDEVLDAIARVLLLDDYERAHLFTLVQGTPYAERPTTSADAVVPASTRAFVARMDRVPALVMNARLDVPAANPLGRALYAQAWEDGEGPDLARYTFLDPRARAFPDPWERSVEVDRSYHSKYDGSPYAEAMATAPVRDDTIEVVPAD
ncbi:helix-turn-helix domain-containing protein, partial [Nocardiopsis protaetiae]